MNLKFLIDMNLSPDWVERFAQEGWDAVHWSTVGDPRALDSVIMDFAQSNGFVVFTHDLDFSAILATANVGGPSVLQVRTQDVTPQHLGSLVVTTIREHAGALESGALITVDEAGARVRILPFA